MTGMLVEVGDIFRLDCNFENKPKMKMKILVAKKPYRFFMINSKINKFTADSPALNVCQIDVPREDHKNFLNHDSIANCTDIVDTSRLIEDRHLVFSKLADHHVGRLQNYVLERIQYNLEVENKVITGKNKKAIIEQILAVL